MIQLSPRLLSKRSWKSEYFKQNEISSLFDNLSNDYFIGPYISTSRKRMVLILNDCDYELETQANTNISQFSITALLFRPSIITLLRVCKINRSQ